MGLLLSDAPRDLQIFPGNGMSRSLRGWRTYLSVRSAPGGRSPGRRAVRRARTQPPPPAWCCCQPAAPARPPEALSCSCRGSGVRLPRSEPPRLPFATPSQPGPMLQRPRSCSLHRGTASVLHCAPRALVLAGAVSECCIGRLAVAKWFLAPPTSSSRKGSGGRRALGRERAFGALAPRAPARAGESAGKCSSLSPPPARSHHRAVLYTP